MNTDDLKPTPSGTVTESGDRSQPLLTFFIPDLTVGGAEQVTVNIVNGLSARGYNIELLLSRREGELQTELDDDIQVRTLPPARTSALGVFAHLPGLVMYLRDQDPVVLFPHLSHVSVACLVVKCILGLDTKIIPTEHKAFRAPTDQSRKDQIVDRLTPLLYPTADRIIAVSEGVADSIATQTRVNRNEISVLHNPVDIESIRARASASVSHKWVEDDTTALIVYVGRLEPQKDLDTWLRAFKYVHDRNPNTRAIIAGKGSCQSELRTTLDRLDLSDVVSMPGYVGNPYRYMKQADVFVLSSRFEGLPTVLIEALACGSPIVSTDCPSGPKEVLADGKFGRLVPVGDSQALAIAIKNTLTEPTDVERLQKRAEAFAPQSVFDDYEQFLNEHVLSDE